MSATPTKLTLTNDGSARVVIGKPPKSKRDAGAKLTLLGTKADAMQVPQDKRLAAEVTFDGDTAKRLRESEALKNMAPKLGLRVA